MQPVDSETVEALKKHISSGEEFAYVVFPDGEARFIDSRSELFRVGFFNSPAGEGSPIAQKSTDKEEYLREVDALAGRLARSGGKAVISRVMAIESAADPADVALDYFAKLPSTFRAVFRTAEAGLWIVATPELVLEELADGSFATISLAGTRSAAAAGEWDEKNRREHDYVTRYIVDTLSSLGLQVDVAPAENLRFGPVEHLCERITARGDADFFSLLENLTPTPAICGYPKADALREIEQIEHHSRYCYGGYIAAEQQGRRKAFLTLRCALVTPAAGGRFCYTVYSGGGITGDSVAADEWTETSGKAALLIESIENSALSIEKKEK